VPRGVKRAKVDRGAARAYILKADEFLASAVAALERSANDAAMLNAIHAAISATDSVTIALAGVRSTDPDHSRAVDLLEEVVGRSSDASGHVKQLRSLISSKNAVEYESRRARSREAGDAVKRARRLVGWARDVALG
jgi:hypothetical protein